MILEPGDVFSITTTKGYGFIQYIETDHLGVDFIRILSPIKSERNIAQIEVDLKERWSIGFILKIASKRKLVLKVGHFKIPTWYVTPKHARSEHNIRGEHLGWRIIERKTLKADFKKGLSKEDVKLSPHGVFNDTLIKEYLEKDWKLENWK